LPQNPFREANSMDAEQMAGLERHLEAYLDRFADCFRRRDGRVHFPV
jgi:hypothetical protein